MSREPEIETREEGRGTLEYSREEKKKGTGETGLNKSRLLLATDPMAIWRASCAAKRREGKRGRSRGKILAREMGPIIPKLISGRLRWILRVMDVAPVKARR